MDFRKWTNSIRPLSRSFPVSRIFSFLGNSESQKDLVFANRIQKTKIFLFFFFGSTSQCKRDVLMGMVHTRFRWTKDGKETGKEKRSTEVYEIQPFHRFTVYVSYSVQNMFTNRIKSRYEKIIIIIWESKIYTICMYVVRSTHNIVYLRNNKERGKTIHG